MLVTHSDTNTLELLIVFCYIHDVFQVIEVSLQISLCDILFFGAETYKIPFNFSRRNSGPKIMCCLYQVNEHAYKSVGYLCGILVLHIVIEYKYYEEYVEIKCQLDATEVFIAVLIACSTYFGHHYAHHQELKSIIQWLLPVIFRAVVFKLLV